jgi:hypothetical protein
MGLLLGGKVVSIGAGLASNAYEYFEAVRVDFEDLEHVRSLEREMTETEAQTILVDMLSPFGPHFTPLQPLLRISQNRHLIFLETCRNERQSLSRLRKGSLSRLRKGSLSRLRKGSFLNTFLMGSRGELETGFSRPFTQ